jgi:ABC-type glycerol-3-phosphate transport system permease component
MPRTPAPAGARLTPIRAASAVAVIPVTVGSPAAYVFASKHLMSRRRLALALGWAIVPLAILVSAPRYARRAQPARGPT